MKLFLKRRALPHREVRRRAPQLPAGRARPRPASSSPSTCSSCVRSQKARRYYGLAWPRPSSRTTGKLRPKASPPGRRHRARHLLRILETRLDNVVYRSSASPPLRAQARQLVRHGHFSGSTAAGSTSRATVSVPDDVVTLKSGSTTPSRSSATRRTDLTAGSCPTWLPGRSRRAHRQGAEVAGARRDRHAGAGTAHRRALQASSLRYFTY